MRRMDGTTLIILSCHQFDNICFSSGILRTEFLHTAMKNNVVMKPCDSKVSVFA